MTPIITLNKFMIFNSSEGREESRESDKLLYHWTREAIDSKVSLEEQIDDVCLCDASISFSNSLNFDTVDSRATMLNERSYTLVFSKTLIVICEVEPEYSIWIAAHVCAPTSLERVNPIRKDEANDLQFAKPQTIPTKLVLQLIRNLYNLFCIVNGKFSMIADEVKQTSGDSKNIRNRIRDLCNRYYNDVIPEINFISNTPTLHHEIIYQNLSLKPLIKVNRFMNHLVCLNTRHIEQSIVIFNDQLVWSSMSLFDTRLVYNYLVSDHIKKALREELTLEVDKVRRLVENQLIYLTNCGDFDLEFDEGVDFECSNIRIGTKKLTPLYMTLFRSSNNMTVGLFLNEPNLLELLANCELMLTRDCRLGVIPLWSLAQSVGQNFLRQATRSKSDDGSKRRSSKY